MTEPIICWFEIREPRGTTQAILLISGIVQKENLT